MSVKEQSTIVPSVKIEETEAALKEKAASMNTIPHQPDGAGGEKRKVKRQRSSLAPGADNMPATIKLFPTEGAAAAAAKASTPSTSAAKTNDNAASARVPSSSTMYAAAVEEPYIHYRTSQYKCCVENLREILKNVDDKLTMLAENTDSPEFVVRMLSYIERDFGDALEACYDAKA